MEKSKVTIYCVTWPKDSRGLQTVVEIDHFYCERVLLVDEYFFSNDIIL